MSMLDGKFDQLRKLLSWKRDIHRSYDHIFATAEGEKVLMHIMSEGYVTRSTHVAGDPHTSALNEGSRRLALSILRMARTDHKSVMRQIEREMQERGMNI